jgi:hypothetical protein
MMIASDGGSHTIIQPIQLRCRDRGIVVDGYEDETQITVHYLNGVPSETITKYTDGVFYPGEDGATIEKIVFHDGEVFMGRVYDEDGYIGLRFDASNQLVHRQHVDGYSPIGSYDEFQLINTATGALAKNYKLEANLDLMEKAWTPVGNSTTRFTGEFDGDSHTISNLTCILATVEEGYAGLFGAIRGLENGPRPVIRNLGITSGEVEGYAYVGAICGSVARYSSIISCYNEGVEITAHDGPGGGICGLLYEYSEMIDCYNNGTVVSYSETNTGGLAGSSYGDIIACYNTGQVTGNRHVGGIAGVSAWSTISNGPIPSIVACYNTGTINGTTHVGGISGNTNGAITACYSTGDVTATGTEEDARGYVGGICGYLDGTYSITACYTTGAVWGEFPAGGICGRVNGMNITACYWYDVLNDDVTVGTGVDIGGGGGSPNEGTAIFGTGNSSNTPPLPGWPTHSLTGWGTSLDGSGGNYWKTPLGDGSSQYPKLYWE